MDKSKSILFLFPKILINSDGKINIYLDSNVFNFLFDNNIDICSEFSEKYFNIYINKQVDFELKSIPENQVLLNGFIKKLLNCCVVLRSPFGFKDERFSDDRQRSGGFGEGFLDCELRCNLKNELIQIYPSANDISKFKGSGMMSQETDVDLASLSINSIVLTNDRKKGPLKYVYEKGCFVIFLNDFNNVNTSLFNYVCNKLNVKK